MVVVAIIILVIPMQHCGNMYGITLNSLETYDGVVVLVVWCGGGGNYPIVIPIQVRYLCSDLPWIVAICML